MSEPIEYAIKRLREMLLYSHDWEEFDMQEAEPLIVALLEYVERQQRPPIPSPQNIQRVLAEIRSKE